MKKIKRVLPIIALVLAVAGFASRDYVVGAVENQTDTIPDRIYIGDIAVGGMTGEEAKAAVEESVAALMNEEFTLKTSSNSVIVTAGELGISWTNTHIIEDAMGIGKTGNLIERYKARKDLEIEDKVYAMEYDINKEMTSAWLSEHAPELNQDAVDNGLKRQDGAFVFIEGQEGIEVDVDASVRNIASYFTEGWDGRSGTIEITANVVEPRGTKEELSKVSSVLGSFSTDFSDSSAGRVANVQNAAGKVDGSLIYPGEEFSVYDAIGPLVASNGYESAPSYENGTTVDSIGGGVCQISTTLYNAVIKAELEITQRSNHSMLVSYVQPSMDAAIAGTYKDLKFKNNTDAPIYIEGYTSGRILYFNVFGHETRDPNREISFISKTTSEQPATTKIEATGDPIGTVTVTQKAHDGKTAELWKIVKVNGVEVSNEVFNTSKYNASPKIISVGTASANPEAVAAINEAIATQDEAAVRAAADYWNDAAVAARAAEAASTQPQDNPDDQNDDSNEDDPNKDDPKKDDPKKDDPKKDDPKKDDNPDDDDTDSGNE